MKSSTTVSLCSPSRYRPQLTAPVRSREPRTRAIAPASAAAHDDSSARVLSVWGVTAALLAVALVAGRIAADIASEESLGMLTAFAAGAVLAALADTIMPEAYAEGGPLVAFATSGGFLLAYALTTLD